MQIEGEKVIFFLKKKKNNLLTIHLYPHNNILYIFKYKTNKDNIV